MEKRNTIKRILAGVSALVVVGTVAMPTSVISASADWVNVGDSSYPILKEEDPDDENPDDSDAPGKEEPGNPDAPGNEDPGNEDPEQPTPSKPTETVDVSWAPDYSYAKLTFSNVYDDDDLVDEEYVVVNEYGVIYRTVGLYGRVDLDNSILTANPYKLCTDDARIELVATFVVDGKEYTYTKINYVEKDEQSHAELMYVAPVAGTCQKPGNIGYYFCSDCGKNFVYSLDGSTTSDGGTYVEIEDVRDDSSKHLNSTEHEEDPATCVKEGTEAYWECEDCHKLFADEDCIEEIDAPVTIEKTAHSYSKQNFVWAVDKDAEEGSMKCVLKVSCSGCGDSFTYEATEEGCSGTVGGEEYTGVITKKLNAPIYCTSDFQINYVATFTITSASGEKRVLSATDSERFAAPGHDLVKHEAREATCETDGNVEFYECQRCGRLYEDADGEVESQNPIIHGGHDFVHYDEKYPTCTEDGHYCYRQCSVCGEYDMEEHNGFVVVKATGHTFSPNSTPTIVYNEDMSKSYAVVECAECHEMVEFKLWDAFKKNEISHATCSKKGYSEYDVIFVYDGKVTPDSSYHVESTIVLDEGLGKHNFNDNGICADCGKAVANVSISKTGETVSTKNRVDIHVGIDELEEGYSVDTLEFFYDNSGTGEYKSVTKQGITSYTGKVADYGEGVKAYAVVTLKNNAEEVDVIKITTDAVEASFSKVSVSVEKTGEKVSSGKNRVSFKVDADVPAGYTVVRTGVEYSNDEAHSVIKTGGKADVTSYSAAIADIGYGVEVTGFVEVKATGSDEIIRITADQSEVICFTAPTATASITGTKVSNGKNRVVFAVNAQAPEAGYTLVKTGVYYDNTQGNSIYNIMTRIEAENSAVKSAGKEADTYLAAVADGYYGVTVVGYAEYTTTDGRTVTVYSEPIHGDYSKLTEEKTDDKGYEVM